MYKGQNGIVFMPNDADSKKNRDEITKWVYVKIQATECGRSRNLGFEEWRSFRRCIVRRRGVRPIQKQKNANVSVCKERLVV
jgi:hypothetical protein